MSRLKGFYYNWRRRLLVAIVNNVLDLSDVSLISMNCIGGVIYHDCKTKFLSPTIDLYFTPRDFLCFVNNLEYYLEQTPEIKMGEEFPIGIIDDIKIYFMHYSSVEEAIEKWETRKKRIHKDKIFIIMVERDGFTEDDFKLFQKISYPKFLFTKSKEYECKNSLYMSKYKTEEQLPDIIPGRFIYNRMKIVKAIKKIQ